MITPIVYLLMAGILRNPFYFLKKECSKMEKWKGTILILIICEAIEQLIFHLK